MEQVRLTADVVLLAWGADKVWRVLVIERGWSPYAGCWAFPGGHVDDGETFVEAARRELTEETRLTVDDIKLVGIYDAPDRDPRGRYVTAAYAAVVRDMPTPIAGDDAVGAQWMAVADLMSGSVALAFDHLEILKDVVEWALVHAC